MRVQTEKENKLDALMMELNEKNKALLESNNKLLSVELELTHKKSELCFIENELKQKVTQNTLLHNEVEELEVLYKEIKAHYDHEYKKNEKSKDVIANRNSKIMDLESTVDKYRTKLGNLELKMNQNNDSLQNKMKEIEYEKNQAIQAAKTLEVQLKEAKNENNYSTEKLETMEKEMVQMKKSLEETEKDFANKIKALQKNAEHKIKNYKTSSNEDIPGMQLERFQANSSPDLGIENKKIKEMQDENTVLRKNLLKAKTLLKKSFAQRAEAKQRAREVEKNICKQIHRTEEALQMAKANLALDQIMT